MQGATGQVEATGEGLLGFLSFAAQKGLMNANTAGSLRAAAKEVLSAVEGEGWEKCDVRQIDVDDHAQRFERLSTGRYKPESLTVYKSRFKNAVGLYLEYLGNPSGWRYKPERPASKRSKSQSTETASNAPKSGPSRLQHTQVPSHPATQEVSSLQYPYPLRPGFVATLTLPLDLTQQEARRLATFVESLAIEPVLRLTGPTGPGQDTTSSDATS